MPNDCKRDRSFLTHGILDDWISQRQARLVGEADWEATLRVCRVGRVLLSANNPEGDSRGRYCGIITRLVTTPQAL